jgi:hypothetical protein
MVLKLFYTIACIFNLANGAWMLFFPLSWYADLPAAIPHTGSYNAHFIRDLGVAFIVAGLGFGWCATHLDRCRPVHLGLTIFFAGHAMIHVADILTGRLPNTHWLIDAPGVFLPAILLVVLAVPSIRKYLGERT